MGLKTKVKVGGINNLSEARYCAGMGVDLLGFSVGKDGLDPTVYKQIIEWLAGPEFVLEVNASDILERASITENFPAHYIRIGISDIDWLEDTSIRFIVHLSREDWQVHKQTLINRKNIAFIELEAFSDKELVQEIAVEFPVLVSANDVGEVSQILHMPNAGVALKGTAEDKPGLKEYALADILEMLEVEFE